MSLKYFHILFISIATLFLVYFGYWNLTQYAAGESYLFLATGIGSFVSAFALVVYGRSFWNKLKDIGFFGLLILLGLGTSSKVWACAVCVGDPTHPMSRALTWSVLFLLIAIMAVLMAIVAFAVNYLKRVKALEARS